MLLYVSYQAKYYMLSNLFNSPSITMSRSPFPGDRVRGQASTYSQEVYALPIHGAATHQNQMGWGFRKLTNLPRLCEKQIIIHQRLKSRFAWHLSMCFSPLHTFYLKYLHYPKQAGWKISVVFWWVEKIQKNCWDYLDVSPFLLWASISGTV